MEKLIYSLLVLAMTAFTFSSCEDVPAPYDTPNQPETPGVDPNAKGSETNPYTVTEAIALIQAGTAPTTEVCVKGTITAVTYYNATYHSLSYNIADTGSSEVLEVYSGKGLNGADFSAKTDLTAGQVVVVKGKIKAFTKSDGTVVNEIDQSSTIISIEGGGQTPDIPSEGYINETFASDFGSFTLKNVKGTPWVIDSYGYAKATGYDNASRATTPSESYIVSKAIDLSASTGATLNFSYVLRYVTKDKNPIEGVKNQVLITDNYTGDPTTTKWTDITGSLTEGTDWKTWQTYSHDLSAYKGKKNVVIALHYACEASSGTWEVKELTVKEGKGSSENPSTPDTPGTSEGISINDLTVTLTNSKATAGESIKIEDISTLSPDANPEKLTLSDGTVLTFEKASGTNAPAYNSKANELRLYANNKLIVKGSKKIAKIIFTCSYDSNKKWNAVGNETATVTFSDNTVTYNNSFSGTGGGVQLRIKSLEIVYAK